MKRSIRQRLNKVSLWLTVGYLLMPAYLAIFHLFVQDDYRDFWWIVTVLFGILALLNGVIRFWPDRKKHQMLILLWIALAIAFVATLCAHDRGLSFWGDNYLHVGWFLYLILTGFFLNAISLSRAEIIKVAKLFVLVATIMGLVAIINNQITDKLFFSENYPHQAKENFPYHGIFVNANHLAYYLTICTVVAAGIFVTAKEKKQQLLYFCCFSILAVLMALSNTVGGYFGLTVGLITLIIIMIKTKHKQAIWRCVAIVAVIFCCCLIPYGNHGSLVGRNISDAFGGRAAKEGREAKMADYGTGRIEIWRDTVKYINRKPLLGYGASGLELEFKRDHKTPDTPHNFVLEIAAYNGIVTAVLVVGFLGWLIWSNIRRLKGKEMTKWAMPAIIAYLVSALFGNITFFVSPVFAIFIGICYTETIKA